jgi:site-specific recombinase XerD
MAFLDFIDERAGVLGRPVRLEEVNGAMLDQWVSGWKSNDLSSKQWRDVAKGFFKWAHERELVPRVPTFDKGQTLRKGNRCGHFEDDQYARLIQTLPFYRSQRVPENFAARMRAFIELGRWAGMAITDIIHFDPARMLDAENVIRYQRRKTKEWAEVALYPDVAARLRSIPPEPGSLPNQPLRFSGRAEHTTEELWRLRFRKICFQAGIREVVTEHGEVRKPHTHMLRDTCAIDAISHGTDLSNVARMLGHKNIQITQRNYLYWITKRSKFCLEDQRASLARRMQVAIDSGAPDVVLAGRPPLVH